MANKIKIIESIELGRVKHLVFNSDRFEGLNGVVSQMGVVRHPGAVVIVPRLPNGQLVLLRQHRYALNDYIYEFPAGTLDRKLESPRLCAEREIIEETGYEARQWKDLGKLYPAPGFSDELQYLFFAEDLSPKQAPQDEDEIIEVHSFSLEKIEAMIATGEICDAKSIAALYRARLLGLI